MGVRFLCNTAIGLALLTAVPFVAVSRPSPGWSERGFSGARERLADVERFRPLMAPRDASITPMQAGVALRALQSGKPSVDFPMREGPTLARPWTDRPVTSAMFAIRNPGSTMPALDWVIAAAAQGFSPDELSYLRVLAEAPIWHEFDRVGRARAVDVIGGQFVLPFRDDAFAAGMPIPRFSDTKQLAVAGVSRAAYYVAIGQPDRAEAALRSIVSFGFAMVDNGTTSIDAIIGRMIMGIGQSAMEQFYAATGGEMPAGTSFKGFRSVANGARTTANAPLSAEDMRRRMLEDVGNPALPRALRFERLHQLSLSSCGSAREILLGPGDDVRNAFDGARTTLARFPSEQAYVDLISQTLSRLPEDKGTRSPFDNLLMGAATVSAAVLNNPRVASCTRIAVMSRPR